MRVAAIDAGTNTFRLLIADVSQQVFNPLYTERVIVRLGEALHNGVLSGIPVENAMHVLKSFASKLKEYGVDKTNCAGTQIFRQADNSGEIIEKIKKETGISLKIVSGKKEGTLTLKGVLTALELKHKYVVVIDIGGGSSELIFSTNQKIKKVYSIGCGVVFFAEKIVSKHRSEIEGLNKCKELFSEKLLETLMNYNIPDFDSLVGTAGTITTIATALQRLKNYNPSKINNFIINKTSLTNLRKKLLTIPLKERGKYPGIEAGRKDLILPGIFMVEALLDYFKKEEITVSDSGLLEGLLFE